MENINWYTLSGWQTVWLWEFDWYQWFVRKRIVNWVPEVRLYSYDHRYSDALRELFFDNFDYKESWKESVANWDTEYSLEDYCNSIDEIWYEHIGEVVNTCSDWYVEEWFVENIDSDYNEDNIEPIDFYDISNYIKRETTEWPKIDISIFKNFDKIPDDQKDTKVYMDVLNEFGLLKYEFINI